jgi:hypothetical protein
VFPEREEESADFGDGVGDEFSGCGVAVGLAGEVGDDSEEGVAGHGEGGPAVPGCPGADLVFVEAGEAFAGLEVLLDVPALPGDVYELGEGDPVGVPAAVVGDLAGVVVAADHQPVPTTARFAGVGVDFGGELDPGPGVEPLTFGPGPC